MSILCSLNNIHLSFGTKTIFNGAEITIHKGDRIGLLGLNGQGKSSLFRILAEEVRPDISEPPFVFHKGTGQNDDSLKYTVFHVPQELPLPENADTNIADYLFVFYPQLAKVHFELQELNSFLESHSSTEKVKEALERQRNLLDRYEHLKGWSLINSYQSYLRYFGHTDLKRLVRDLSGGEQKKILLALGLSSEANLILWDEPTNHLDLETIKLFEDELSTSNQTYLLISHDRYLLSKLTNVIFHIERGVITKFDGSYSDYLEHIAEKEEERQRLLAKLKNSLRRETEWMRQGIKARGCRSKKRVEGYENLFATVSDLKARAKKELELTISASDRKTKSLVQFKEVTFSYPDKAIFEPLTFNVHRGNKIGLLGINGAGKTTLVNLIAGNLHPSSGEIRRADDLVIQHFTQKRQELDLEKTPHQVLGEGEDFVHLPGGRDVHVVGYFESFLFNRNDIHRPLSTLSGGEKNRLQMALNLKRAGDIWIFDEPTNDLDLESLQILEQKLSEFQGTVIIISHDRAFLSSVTDTVWLIHKNKIETFNGGYSQVEPYLEALLFEDMLEREDEGTSKNEEETTAAKISVPTTESTSSAKKLTNKQKERLKNIPQLIVKKEQELAIYEQKVATFDFADNSFALQQEYAKLSESREKLEEELLELYAEQEELS